MRAALAALGLALALGPGLAGAEPSAPAVEQRRQPTPTADSEYDRGMRARVARDWTTAEAAFRRAITLRAGFADAWNELGFALRNQGHYPESLAAYDEALVGVIRDEAGLTSVPVVTGMDFGHTDPVWTLPQGVHVRVDPSDRRVRFLEAGVRA